MKELTLTQGLIALVDDADYGWVSQSKWRAMIGLRNRYAVRWLPDGHGKRKLIRMHREIAGTAPGMETDHINGNGLDNRRANLRECTRTENARNSRSRLGASSQYLGVCWDKSSHKWRATIMVGYRQRHLGYFAVEADAAQAFKQAAATVHGEFAAGSRGDR